MSQFVHWLRISDHLYRFEDICNGEAPEAYAW